MKYALAFALAFALFFPLAAAAITINTVPVGNPGNAPRINDGGGNFGNVATAYRIATTEVTNAQYVEFLNAVAASDPNGLYNNSMNVSSRGGIIRTGSSGSYSYSIKPDFIDEGTGFTYTYGDKPVIYTSWYDAARFANWMNNGATAGASTETGAYTMANGLTVSRNANATWFLPTENQWYKAAYHKNDGVTDHYWDYSTGTNAVPDNNEPIDDSGDSVNYYNGAFTVDISYPYTAAGSYTLSTSPYGTMDQGGNVWEWTETFTSATSTRVRRGGAADTYATTIVSSYRENKAPTTENDNMGFRLATIAGGVTGDYNGNNIVDAADYVLWRKFNGQSVTLPNDSTPGTVSAADYTEWRTHFGQTPSGSGLGSLMQTSIPEPSFASMIGLALYVSLFHRRKNQKFAASRTPKLY